MESSFLIIVSVALSGLLATLITLWVQRKTRKYNSKFKIFETLMSYRYNIVAEDNVRALNSIDVIFYKNEKVRKAFEDFLNEVLKKPDTNPEYFDKYLRLLEEMAVVLDLKNIRWDCIKRMYYPIGLSDKINEENELRKMLLQNATENYQNMIAYQNNSENKVCIEKSEYLRFKKYDNNSGSNN